ncbi:hypothetical protein [Thermophilibacter immobilis]|jgi:hypothetical protein|uniref:Cell envelope-related transcriptional attenuator domain-containing protein n=1 Tax=Thermophilibacter immobilis TaxID=2779519 RepID=A0A7S7M887_9ACTN|nr:hypothetical protein [Thermophilibacter immobilis]QOY60448.1 hypothetical protein INP52_08590 [Thermophilibacter immobilis]
MPRKREKFDRIDVPRESPHKNVMGAVISGVVLVAAALVVGVVWNRVQLESRLGDTGLTSAVGAQSSTSVSDESYVASTDEFECILLFTADSLDQTGATLNSARILALNKTQGTAILADVPLEATLSVQDSSVTLSDLYTSSGYAACVAPLSKATNVEFAHVVVATDDVLEEASSLAGSSASELVSSASGLLSKIRTDMGAQELLSLAQTLSSVGRANLTRVDATLVPQTTTDDEGSVTETGSQVIDATQLDVALGLLVAAE